ncbi:hypothetical protein ERO13_A04G109150v2 [Gossypium hirsutum]|uniref:Uncharacterized protein n=1 Tax=Gossypium tomentosum TaxID=34277 RepID=A0A5D2R1N7_GOSTO|nr:hypothetical protein ERO13_A04G109150v2 [Gossypium hirsutum]TYI33590.1 hypothetical protein ES332_A04G145200v1 [Gossypium tomentosum]
MMKGKEKVSNESAAKPSGVSIIQSPTLPSLPPRNRDEEEDVYADDNNQQILIQDFRRHLQETRQTIQEMMKIQRWKPFAGA